MKPVVKLGGLAARHGERWGSILRIALVIDSAEVIPQRGRPTRGYPRTSRSSGCPPDEQGRGDLVGHLFSLISGERDAVLINAALTLEEAGRIVEWIRATGKNLTTIYVTHGQAITSSA